MAKKPKKVVIDGVEYVPKPKHQAPTITNVNVTYEPVYAGYQRRLSASIPVSVELTIVNIYGNERTVEIPYPLAKEVLEAIM